MSWPFAFSATALILSALNSLYLLWTVHFKDHYSIGKHPGC